jgi:membrane-bound lytic murein transglycosylase C
MFKTAIFSTLLLSSSFASSSFNDYKASLKEEFSKEKVEFQNYKKAQQRAFESYKKELQKYWKKPLITTKKQLVSYAKDKKSRSIIDFEHNKLTIQTVAKSKEEAQQNLTLTLAKAVTFNAKDFYDKDTLAQTFTKIDKSHKILSSEIDTAPVLAPIIFKKAPTKKSLYKFIKKELTPTKVLVTQSTKLNNAKLYTLQIKLPKNSTFKRSRIYYNIVKQESDKEHIQLSLIFAIIHSESSFNPMARSYIPAYGLMQIVPKTAGIDSYFYLYKQKRLVGSSYLYNAKNNIKIGSAYLHILYYKYLKDIKNPTSRLYCTIAAYNTGAGNVARAFVGTTNRYRAAQIINRLSPEEVYAKLLRDLKYDEPKKYLIKVRKRVKIYRKLYES